MKAETAKTRKKISEEKGKVPAVVLSILEENQRILKNKLNEHKIKKLMKSLQSEMQPQTGNLIKFSFLNLTLYVEYPIANTYEIHFLADSQSYQRSV